MSLFFQNNVSDVIVCFTWCSMQEKGRFICKNHSCILIRVSTVIDTYCSNKRAMEALVSLGKCAGGIWRALLPEFEYQVRS